MALFRRAVGQDAVQLGIAQRLARSFRAATALMALAVLVAIVSLTLVLSVCLPHIHHDVDARSGARIAEQGMLDEQAALRGYLLSPDRSLLDAYRTGERQVSRGDAQVEANLGSNSPIAALAAEVRAAEQAWTARCAKAALEQPPPPPTSVATLLQRDASLFESYQSQDDRLVSALVGQYDGDRRAESLALGVGGGLQVLILGLLLLFLLEEHRRLRHGLLRPFDNLLAKMRQVRDGDLAVQAAVEGPIELRQVSDGFNEMTHALAEERAQRASRETEVMYNAARLRELLEMARNLAGSLNLRYVLDAVSSHAVSLSGCEHATVWLADDDRPRLTAEITATAGGTGPAERDPVEMGAGSVGQAARFGRAISGPGGAAHDPPGALTVTAVPMIVGAHVVGVIELASLHAAAIPQAVMALVETLASHAGTAIEAARLHARTEELSQVDALTRLFNRRRLEGDLDRECKRSRRYDRPLAFCMLDVDHFKEFNDRHGHRRGDAVLQEVGVLLRDAIRGSDSAYRYGGEEFGLLLRDTTLGAAAALCERLRVRIAERFPEGQRITASFGVAAFVAAMQAPEELIEAADRALYRAKRAGRDRVEVDAGEAARQPPA